MVEIIAKNANSNPRRSIVKAISWRILGSLDTALWTFFFTGSAKAAGLVATAEAITKIILYYLHERAWAHSRFGLRKIEPLSEDV